MNHYKSIDELIVSLPLLDQGEWIYVNLDSWENNPENTGFYYIPWNYIQDLNDEEIYFDEENMEMPLVVKELNLKGWMLVSSLHYIVKNKSNNRHNNQWLIEEINYYREDDTFRT